MPPFPKLLVATEFPPNMPGGGGAIVRQMLKEWPVDRLFWWSCQRETAHRFGQRTAGHFVATIPDKLYPTRRARKQKSWALETFWTPWATGHLRKTLKTVAPDIVWVIPHGFSTLPLTSVLLPARIPYHISVYDYADCRPMVWCYGEKVCRRMTDNVDKLYLKAASRDTVSVELTADFQTRLGVLGGITRTGLEPADFAALQSPAPPAADAIRIAYAGTIVADEEFAAFISVLAKVRPRLPKPLSLEFFGDHSYRQRSWFDASWMKAHGNLAAPQLFSELRKCTWGFSPMVLTDEDPRYNHFSLPSKFVSYLIAGLPVITLGHPQCTVIKMAARYQVGLSFTEINFESVQSKLLEGLSEPDPKKKYHAEILRCARAEFDARQMRDALYESFRQGAALSR